MRLYLIRHAESEKGSFHNDKLKLSDAPITDKGRQLSLVLLKTPIFSNVTSIIISEYIRTAQTIEHFATELGIKPKIDSRLNEIDFGSIINCTYKQIEELHPKVFSLFENSDNDVRFPDGETCQEAQSRIVNLISEIDTSDGNVILVTHGGIIRTLLCYIIGLPAYKCFDFNVDPLGIMEIQWNQKRNKYMLQCFNQKIY